MTVAEERVVQHVLDHPARAALLGPHAHLAVRRSRVVRYRPDVAGFVTMPADPGPGDWQDLADLVGPGARVALSAITTPAPPDWEIVLEMAGVQLTGERIRTAPDADAVRLDDADVPDMLDLVARTEPGPFLPRTIEMGRYLGIRRNGRLVAMAGERLRPAGWTEVSAVCTDPAYRGQGLASRRRSRHRRSRGHPVPARACQQHQRDQAVRDARLSTAPPDKVRCLSRAIGVLTVGGQGGELVVASDHQRD